MDTRKIDQLNIGLMLGSFVLAYVFPFQLFLFSFAVLGPLHYFTEIPWLNRKQYYTTAKYDYIVLIALTSVIAFVYYNISSDGVANESVTHTMAILVFTTFMAAFALSVFKSYWQKLLAIAIVGASAFLFVRSDLFTVIFATLLISIIHVWLFTGLFILLGALRHKSVTGIVSLIVFVGCSVAFLMITPDPQMNRSLSDYVRSSYSQFAGMNFDIMNTLGLAHVGHHDSGLAQLLFDSDLGIMVMRLVAFSYTYHFLNWFSKTSVIKWHHISRRALVIVAILWVGSLVLYAVNYELGLQYLYAMSLLHVVLEFPLNHQTFIGIGREMKKMVMRTPATVG